VFPAAIYPRAQKQKKSSSRNAVRLFLIKYLQKIMVGCGVKITVKLKYVSWILSIS
jgi:hypothetical protein